ncbi:hypothetical protein EV207_13830 [Scopulibacillus darangshiensis]|uniref:Spore germination protein GerPA/GerPF n=1 Tax=Scopulibacillus darangshiensis TaxID=442528 RepID=A0A4R2NK70_9BACL|nr:hypothetical protein [Scopulibacillus darangshiensis]TCP21943.1 hypothetical protein EV207_13830 [Scopulibacillus darangshiensis]
MLLINAGKIKIDTMKYNTGAFFGSTYAVNWNGHFKSNTNHSEVGYLNGSFRSINIVNDSDGIDNAIYNKNEAVTEVFY